MPIADLILQHLNAVEAERAQRFSEAGLDAKVRTIKEYQQRRFCHTYADLLGSRRYGPAARFFLDELYGPGDYTQRDTQFARVVPTMVRLFPQEIINTVASLAELHALSERLDTAMGRNLMEPVLDAGAYVRAWQATGGLSERTRQIDLTLGVAGSLDRLTQRPLIRGSLRLMRGPAHAAGLGELQQFLESGFDTFKAMKGASEFVALVESRERALADALFVATPPVAGESSVASHAVTLLPSPQ